LPQKFDLRRAVEFVSGFVLTKEVSMSEKKRILVVDDEPDFAAIVQENLEKEGFEVEVAYDGIEGLEKVHANPPDAIVLDVMMPEKDGYRSVPN
jgi:CheY-like chemotaxis protein